MSNVEENQNNDMQDKVTPSAWSDELLEKYGELSLPSLYDYLLNQEKLAVEIRRQNKEIRGYQQILQEIKGDVGELNQRFDVIEDQLNSPLNKPVDEVDQEDFKQEELELDQESVYVLIQSMDMIFNWLQATEKFSENLSSLVPKPIKFWPWPHKTWHTHFEEVIQGYTLGIELTRQKMLSFLADKQIEIIHPKIGSFFDAHLQRAVEKIKGGKPFCIAKVIRYGYARKGNILRFADVSVYESK